MYKSIGLGLRCVVVICVLSWCDVRCIFYYYILYIVYYIILYIIHILLLLYLILSYTILFFSSDLSPLFPSYSPPHLSSSLLLFLSSSVLYSPIFLPSPPSNSLIQSIRVGIWIHLFIFSSDHPNIPKFDPACFIGVDG